MTTDLWLTGRRFLARRDPVMGRLLRSAGPCPLRRERNHFRRLAKAIVGQQLSTKAADSIWGRLEEALQGKVEAESLLQQKTAKLRTLGLSGQKTDYLQGLARRVSGPEASLLHPA